LTEPDENPVTYTKIMSGVEASVLLSGNQVIAKESSDDIAAAIQDIISRNGETLQDLAKSFTAISIYASTKQLQISNLGNLHLVTLAKKDTNELLLETLLNLAARDILEGKGIIAPAVAKAVVWHEFKAARLTGLMKGDLELHETWKNRWLQLPQSGGSAPRKVTIMTTKGKTVEKELKFTRTRSEGLAMLSVRLLKELEIQEGDKVQISPNFG